MIRIPEIPRPVDTELVRTFEQETALLVRFAADWNWDLELLKDDRDQGFPAISLIAVCIDIEEANGGLSPDGIATVAEVRAEGDDPLDDYLPDTLTLYEGALFLAREEAAA